MHSINVTLTYTGVLYVQLHRIRMLKYYDRILWDREARIDHVFQSTPGACAATDVVTCHATCRQSMCCTRAYDAAYA